LMDPQSQYLEKCRSFLPLLNHPKVHMQTLEKFFVFWYVNFVMPNILSVENGKMLIDTMALFEFFKGENVLIAFDDLLKVFGSMTKRFLKRLPWPKSHIFECRKLAEDILQYFDNNVITFESKFDFGRIFSKSSRKRAHCGEVKPKKRIKKDNSILLNTHDNKEILSNIEYTDFNPYDVFLEEFITNFEQNGNFEDGMTTIPNLEYNSYEPQTIEYVGERNNGVNLINCLNDVENMIPNQDNGDYKLEDAFPEIIEIEYMKDMTQYDFELNGI